MIYTMQVTLEVGADTEHEAYGIVRKIMKRGNEHNRGGGVRYIDAECTEHTDLSQTCVTGNVSGPFGICENCGQGHYEPTLTCTRCDDHKDFPARAVCACCDEPATREAEGFPLCERCKR